MQVAWGEATCPRSHWNAPEAIREYGRLREESTGDIGTGVEWVSAVQGLGSPGLLVQ